MLPDGWQIIGVSGDATPELVTGEIVWTGAIPPSPVRMTYALRVRASEREPKQVRAELEYHVGGMANPERALAAPDLSLIAAGPPLSVRPDGNRLVLAWPADNAGGVVETADSLTPPVQWRPLNDTPVVDGGQNVIAVEPRSGSSFYRLRNP